MKLFFMILLLTYGAMATDAIEAAKKLGAENNYATAIQKAKTEKKLLVMVIVQENCRWCEKLIDKTLNEETVRHKLENYIMLIVDKNDDFPSDFKENLYPSIFYIDYSTQKSVYSNVGFVGIPCFLNDLNGSLEIRNSRYENKE
jgi:thioredoxin-related protein